MRCTARRKNTGRRPPRGATFRGITQKAPRYAGYRRSLSRDGAGMRSWIAGMLALVAVAGCGRPDGAARPIPSLPAEEPRAGAQGAGDDYFPAMGNGGYDVGRYTL